MKSKKVRVVLLFGGRSAEHEISLISASSIYRNLDRTRYDIFSIYINKKGEWKEVASPLLPLESLEEGKAFSFLPWVTKALTHAVDGDIFFPVLHGPFGEDGTIQGLLEMADVPYVGAGVLASAVGMDKAMMKALFLKHNLPVVKHKVIIDADWTEDQGTILSMIEKEFRLPFFIKPSNLGSSVGITKVKEFSQAEAAVQNAFRYDRKILVEEGIEGRELECSVLGNDRPRASLPGEIIPFREFYDYKDKYIEGKTRFGIPAELPDPLVKEVQRLSIGAFKAVDCSGMARVDFFLQGGTEKIFVNEINTIPGFTAISMYPKLWEVSGLPYPRLIEELIDLGFSRHREKKRCLESQNP